MPNFDENEPLEIVKPVITNPVKVRTTRTVPEVGQNDLAEFAQRLLGKPLESDMQRALTLAERQHADFAAVTHRLIDILAEAAPSMPAVAAALTALPVSGSPIATDAGNKPAAQKPAGAEPKPATTPADPRKAASAPADPAADNVARERPKRRRF